MSTAIQLPEQAKGSQMSWSLSRHDTFTTCKRKYWLNYYGSFVVEEVDRLKQLSSLDLWVGNLVHDTIETFLKLNDAIPSKDAQERLIRQVTHGQMPQDWGYSLANAKRFRLFEHEYEREVSQEDKKLRVALVVRCLRSFFASDILAEAMSLGRKSWLSIDELKSYRVDGVKVFAAMDFAYRLPDGRVRIVDWKTGRSAGRLNKHQLAGYALLALQENWAAAPDQVDTVLAYLAVPDYKVRVMTEKIIAEARERIAESAGKMRAMVIDLEKNIARLEDFPRTDNLWDCRRCQFQRVCFPGGAPA